MTYELFFDHYNADGDYTSTEKVAQGPEEYLAHVKETMGDYSMYSDGKSVAIIAPYGEYYKYKDYYGTGKITRSQYAIDNNL